MKNMESYLGIVAIATLVIVLFLIFYFGTKSKRMSSKFDERQIAARGKAFEVGFYTFVICNVALAVANEFGFHWAVSTAIEIFFVLFIAIGAFIITAIRKDAYFGMNENSKSSTILLALIALLNLVTGMSPIISGEKTFLKNGKAGYTVLNFAITVLFVIVIIVSSIHKKKQTSSSDEEL